MANNSISFVRFLFATTMIFAVAFVLSAKVTSSTGPLALGVTAFGVFLLAEITRAYRSEKSALRKLLTRNDESGRPAKYGGFALGGIAVAYIVAMGIVFTVLKAIL